MKKPGEWWTRSWTPGEHELEAPLRWRKRYTVAVGLMEDPFHESLSDEEIELWYAVMGSAARHRFAVLTKRPERRHRLLTHWSQRIGSTVVLKKNAFTSTLCEKGVRWPLPNVIEMISASTQAELDERWPWLARTPAAKRGLHLEPLLGEIRLPPKALCPCSCYAGKPRHPHPDCEGQPTIDSVVCGGETGPGARPMHPGWVRKIRDDCAAAGVPYWFQGWGEWAPASVDEHVRDYLRKHPPERIVCPDGMMLPNDSALLHPRMYMRRVGRKAAGRLLDGREWDEVPR